MMFADDIVISTKRWNYKWKKRIEASACSKTEYNYVNERDTSKLVEEKKVEDHKY